MATLFETGTIGPLELKNRIVMAPMCMYEAEHDGLAKTWHQVHYATRAIGGVGLILLEATAVEPRGRISANDLGIWSDEHIDPLKRIVDTVHAYGAKIGIQLAHAGRKCQVATEAIIAPSSIRFSERYNVPREMTKTDIQTVIEAFKEGARRAREAGFDVIEIHGAHGYLINEFLSPVTNRRTDEYGGSLVNRVRFLQEVLGAVRTAWPKDKPIILRLSAEEYVAEGHHIEDTIQVVQMVKDQVDAINVSSGGVVATPVPNYPGYQIPYATRIKEACGVTTIGGGLINHEDLIEDILQNGRADFVYLGRLLLRDPYFLLKVAHKRGLKDIIPQAYMRGFYG